MTRWGTWWDNWGSILTHWPLRLSSHWEVSVASWCLLLRRCWDNTALFPFFFAQCVGLGLGELPPKGDLHDIPLSQRKVCGVCFWAGKHQPGASSAGWGLLAPPAWQHGWGLVAPPIWQLDQWFIAPPIWQRGQLGNLIPAVRHFYRGHAAPPIGFAFPSDLFHGGVCPTGRWHVHCFRLFQPSWLNGCGHGNSLRWPTCLQSRWQPKKEESGLSSLFPAWNCKQVTDINVGLQSFMVFVRIMSWRFPPRCCGQISTRCLWSFLGHPGLAVTPH